MKTQKLQGGLAIGLMVLSTLAPAAGAQSGATGSTTQPVPNAPAPVPAAISTPAPSNVTEPYSLRPTDHDYSRGKSQFPNPFSVYTGTTVPPPRLTNSSLLDTLYRDGKIYLSLNDAIMLALQNNFDVAIARYNLDIADTDLLRARSGLPFLGVNTGLVTGTLGGSTSPVASSSPFATTGTSGTGSATSTTIQTTGAAGGGPGGTSAGAGGAGSGTNGITATTLGAGPLDVPIEPLDPVLTSNLSVQRSNIPQTSNLITGTFQLNQNQNVYDFGYTQGFLPGETLAVTFNNSRSTTNESSPFSNFFSPVLNSTFNVQLTQHLLQGFGWTVNGRYIAITKNNRRITDSAFRAQLLYTIDQIENIYWGLVSAYEDEKAKEGALKQSTQLAADNQKQLQIGTLAPLDVVNSNAQVASDKQALISAQSKLQYQQLIIKQAIARNLDDSTFANAPVIPTDRVSLEQTPEERKPLEELVQEAYANSPGVEQAKLNLKNQEITLKSVKNALLPQLDVYALYGAAAVGGSKNPLVKCGPIPGFGFDPCTGVPGLDIPYGDVLQNLFNSSGANKGVGFNFTVPIRNRQAQAQQARAQLEYRQSQMRLQQLYVQLRMQVTNQLYALQNDRAQVQAAQASQSYALQSLDAEQKKYRLGASTTANVLSQTRNLEAAEDNLIAAHTAYAVDRAALSQMVADTLDKYGIGITDAATGNISHEPLVPGLQAPQPQTKPEPLHNGPRQDGTGATNAPGI
ncbi:MAG TPA: TolC family protein [Acidobacteriaceae bacterium]|nr:TolC family protein [Acidobacteriaceae bacterium]